MTRNWLTAEMYARWTKWKFQKWKSVLPTLFILLRIFFLRFHTNWLDTFRRSTYELEFSLLVAQRPLHVQVDYCLFIINWQHHTLYISHRLYSCENKGIPPVSFIKWTKVLHKGSRRSLVNDKYLYLMSLNPKLFYKPQYDHKVLTNCERAFFDI